MKKDTTYVALLRGINVGGKSLVGMDTLKDCFEKIGFDDVRTYINSGNVLFTASETEEAITKRIEGGLKKHFGREIRALVRSDKQIRLLAKKIPAHWANDATMKTDVMFLWKEVANTKATSAIVTNPAVDKLLFPKGAIIWKVNRREYGKSKLTKLVGTLIYKKMTIRNANTVRKLHHLMSTTHTARA